MCLHLELESHEQTLNNNHSRRQPPPYLERVSILYWHDLVFALSTNESYCLGGTEETILELGSDVFFFFPKLFATYNFWLLVCGHFFKIRITWMDFGKL